MSDKHLGCVTVERTFQGWRVSAMVGDYRESEHYIGFSRAEAIADFRATYRIPR